MTRPLSLDGNARVVYDRLTALANDSKIRILHSYSTNPMPQQLEQLSGVTSLPCWLVPPGHEPFTGDDYQSPMEADKDMDPSDFAYEGMLYPHLPRHADANAGRSFFIGEVQIVRPVHDWS